MRASSILTPLLYPTPAAGVRVPGGAFPRFPAARVRLCRPRKARAPRPPHFADSPHAPAILCSRTPPPCYESPPAAGENETLCTRLRRFILNLGPVARTSFACAP